MPFSLSFRILIHILLIQFILFGALGMSILGLFPMSSYAVYTESDNDSFASYKKRLESLLQDVERNFRVNGSITDADISSIRNLVIECYNRLPDTPDVESKNETMRKGVELYLDLAARNKGSQIHVGNALSEASRFVSQANISQISGSIEANPTEGNGPLTVSFLGSAKDPSGVNIPDNNYIWWTRESGGVRREIGRGPTLTYTFHKEGNYQVFLDVISGSRNKKGKIDVLPLSISKDIVVKPKLGNIVLLVNGVNISTTDSIKINPTLAKIGLIFDATASRALSNATIVKTKWDFGNGNISEYPGAPIIERQIYAIQGQYTVTLEITNNQGQSFKKTFQLIVRDPSATITMDKEIGYVGDTISFSAKSYFGNTSTVEYSWNIQDRETGKSVISKSGPSFSHAFSKIGDYIVTLEARSANGNIDQDSKVITIESREPIVNLDTPRPISPERPNTFVFDASRSFDPDTKSSKNLTYSWFIDGERVKLDNVQKDGAIGTYTFQEKGTHTVSLTVANSYGKVKTVDKTFEVNSTLTIGMNISPRVAPIGTTINFQARSPRAKFFEWNVGDGSQSINGIDDFISHVYKKTGIYSATLTVKNADGSESNTIERKVYITDTNSPFALIDVRNGGGSAYENPRLCGSGAFQINRSENVILDGGNSINVDGSPSGLSYTWKYQDKIKTGPSLSEKFSELGCFSIDLTVKSDKNGATHSSRRYIYIENILPKITSIDANIDTTKKDSQKLIVNVTANGARDEDGVITSYIWYYKTESDSEPQNIKITQSPKTTFVIPNISEKYTFGVILEDNDGARVNSSDIIRDQAPLIITNDEGNINLPLISLSMPKSQLLAGEKAEFSVTAKNILGTDITEKSEYVWDFDGDGKVDQKTKTPQISHVYRSSGKYTMKVKVIYNGVSNTKYQVINVKNELKANAKGYKVGEKIYFINTSVGSYDRAVWKVGKEESESLYDFVINASELTENPILTVSSGNNESSSREILPSLVEEISSGTGILVQSSLGMSGDTISIPGKSDILLISLFGNEGTKYIIDTDTRIDNDLDGVTYNDIDNKNTPSYEDGRAFLIRTQDVKSRKKEIRVEVLKNGISLGSRTITLIFEYIPDTEDKQIQGLSGSGISAIDRGNLEKLQAKIRSLASEDRVILTQYYNNLIENWDDLHDRTEWLITIQKAINDSTTISNNVKEEISTLLDIILVGDAQAVNEITVATKVIEGLIKSDDPDRGYIIERLEKIKAHPGNLSENKKLGTEILEKLVTNKNISNEDKLIIKSQLLIITSGGEESVSGEEKEKIIKEGSKSSGFLGFIRGVVWIFLTVIGIIILILLFGYIFYRFSRKNNDTGFQDFLIDSIAHSKKQENSISEGQKVHNTSPATVTPVPPVVNDPLTNIVIPVKKEESQDQIVTPIVTPSDPLKQEIQDLSPSINKENNITPESQNLNVKVAPMVDITEGNPSQTNTVIPDWLKPISEDTTKKDIPKESPPPAMNISPIETPIQDSEKQGDEENPGDTQSIVESQEKMTDNREDIHIIPDWLIAPGNGGGNDTDTKEENPEDINTKSEMNISDPMDMNYATDLPDWLKDSLEEESSPKKIPPKKKEKTSRKKGESDEKKESSKKEKSPNTISSDDIPDWLK